MIQHDNNHNQFSVAEHTASINGVLQQYFDGLYQSDVTQLQEVFHPLAIYACAVGGELIYYTMKDYLPIVAQRPSPKSRGEARQDRVLAIEVVGIATAVARVTCAIAPKQFNDVLSLVYLDGRWQIIAKVFDYQISGN